MHSNFERVFVGSRPTPFRTCSRVAVMLHRGPPYLELIDCIPLNRLSQSVNRMGSNSGHSVRRVRVSEPSNAGKPWNSQDLLFLRDALQRGMSHAEAAGFLSRTEEEVRAKVETWE
jgi:hypothetical protein